MEYRSPVGRLRSVNGCRSWRRELGRRHCRRRSWWSLFSSIWQWRSSWRSDIHVRTEFTEGGFGGCKVWNPRIWDWGRKLEGSFFLLLCRWNYPFWIIMKSWLVAFFFLIGVVCEMGFWEEYLISLGGTKRGGLSFELFSHYCPKL